MSNKNMETNYWDDKNLIFARKEEKEKLLAYEIWMFHETCNQIAANCSRNQFEDNLLLESLAVHARLLIDLFYGDLFCTYKKGRDRGNINDIIAQDFLAANVIWLNERPKLTQALCDAKRKANKQLAHLSTWRIKIDRDDKKSWDWMKINEDMEKVIAKFESLK